MVTFVQCVLSYHLSQSFTLLLFQSNVLCSDGHYFLTDFGISEIPPFSNLARLVNRGWAAPELDQQSCSKESDIFSFACTVYEVLVYFLDLSSLFVFLTFFFA